MKWLLFIVIPLVYAKSDLPIYHGVIAVTNDGDETDVNKFCANYNLDWFTSTIHDSLSTSPKYPLYGIDQTINGCDQVTDLHNKSVLIIDTDPACSVVDRTKNLVGAELIVIARTNHELNVTDDRLLNFSTVPIVLINSDSYHAIKSLSYSQGLSISFYSPVPKFDTNVIAIYVICVFCIVVGSYWSLYPSDMKFSELWTTYPKPPIRLKLHTSDAEEEDDGKGSLWTNILFGVIIVSIMAGMLLLLYFAYKYFVFVFMALFCVIASTGMYSILFPFFAEMDCFHTRWQISCFQKEKYFAPFRIALWLACFSVTMVWFAFRHEPNIWPLQVVMGISVCLNIIKSVPLPSLKIIAIVMCMLFIYDIFFVFITPLFTKDGVSIMERVATGASSKKQVFGAPPSDYTPGEQIPLSIKIPWFQKTDLKICMPVYSMIGFGDIVIPGLLTAYSAYFDTIAHPGKTKWYYIITCTSYAIGLIITYAALIGMGIAQPALLYLVPCCLIGVFGTALKRGEVHAMWTGRAGVAAVQENGFESLDRT